MRLRQPFVLAAAALLAAVAAADELKTLASVAELHAMTAESAGRGVALLVYAPWCGHSRALLPHVEKAAAQLKGKVGFAKVDGTEAEALATKLDVKGYPTLLYVRSSDGPPIEFDGAREASAIVRWAQQKMEPAMARLGSAAEVTKWAGGKKPVALVLFTTPSADASADAKAAEEALLGVAAAAEHVPCAIATVAPSEASLGLSAAVGGVALTPPLLVAFITHDDGQPLLLAPSAAEPLTHARMLRFARAAALPAVSAYENGAAEEALFGADVPLHLLYFHEAPLADDVRRTLTAVGKQLRGQAALATVDTAKHAEVAAFFDVKPSGALPAPTLMAFALDESIKYVHSGALSADAIAAFASDATAGKATVHLRSQPPPESAGGSGAPVELVGSTFAQVAHDSSKDVLVQFYAPTCGHCNKLKPVYASVAAHFADDADMVVAQMDASANDILGLEPEGYPTILLYLKGNKRGIEYDGSRDAHDLIQFVVDARAGRHHIGGLPEQMAGMGAGAGDGDGDEDDGYRVEL